MIFFVIYQALDFCSEDLGLFPMPDNGDIGQFFRVYQMWIQWCRVGSGGNYYVITGTVERDSGPITCDILALAGGTLIIPLTSPSFLFLSMNRKGP